MAANTLFEIRRPPTVTQLSSDRYRHWPFRCCIKPRFGKRGELASNRREEQELGMLCLHILQSSLGLINTLMIQDTLALPEWADVLTDADRRGLTPVFHTNMTPYGEIQLRTDRRLDRTGIPPAAT